MIIQVFAKCTGCDWTDTYRITEGCELMAICIQCQEDMKVMPGAKTDRPSWDEYFMHIALIASTRATCDRRHVGCVIVTGDSQVVSTGYNGSAPGAPHCDDIGHLLHDGHCVRTIHAEANAIAQAARQGKSTRGCTIYVTTHPCPVCLMLLAAAGVMTVVHYEDYHEDDDNVSLALAGMANIALIRYDGRKLWEQPILR